MHRLLAQRAGVLLVLSLLLVPQLLCAPVSASGKAAFTATKATWIPRSPSSSPGDAAAYAARSARQARRVQARALEPQEFPMSKAKGPGATTREAVQSREAGNVVFSADADLPGSGSTWFDGLEQSTTSIPPDGGIAVGPNRVACFANGDAGLYLRETFESTSSVSLDQFHQASGTFDPRALYDWQRNRFVVASVSGTGEVATTSSVELAWSNGDAPDNLAGDWSRLSVQVGTNGNWADYPHLGIGAHNIFISVNMFLRTGPSSHTFVEALLYTIPAAKAFDATLANPDIVVNSLSEFTHAVPVVIQPASSNHVYMITASNGNSGTYLISRFLDEAVPVVQDMQPVQANAFQSPDNGDDGVVSQLGTGFKVLANDDRISGSPFQVGSKLYFSHCVLFQGTAHVRWFVVDAATSSILDSGQVGSKDTEYFFPVIGADTKGNIGMLVSVGGEKRSIGTTWFYRRVSDPPGTMRGPFDAGTSTGPVLISRWGDYGGLSVDPTNGQMWSQNTRYVAESGSDWRMVVVEACPACEGDCPSLCRNCVNGRCEDGISTIALIAIVASSVLLIGTGVAVLIYRHQTRDVKAAAESPSSANKAAASAERRKSSSGSGGGFSFGFGPSKAQPKPEKPRLTTSEMQKKTGGPSDPVPEDLAWDTAGMTVPADTTDGATSAFSEPAKTSRGSRSRQRSAGRKGSGSGSGGGSGSGSLITAGSSTAMQQRSKGARSSGRTSRGSRGTRGSGRSGGKRSRGARDRNASDGSGGRSRGSRGSRARGRRGSADK